MSKARIIGAGLAGSSGYNVNANLNTGGGNKKQGFPFTLGSPLFNSKEIKRRATGPNRNVVFFINQVGGPNRTNHFNGGGVHRFISTATPPAGNFLRIITNESGTGAYTLTVSYLIDYSLLNISGLDLSGIQYIQIQYIQTIDPSVSPVYPVVFTPEGLRIELSPGPSDSISILVDIEISFITP
jgi:hypothetical protein